MKNRDRHIESLYFGKKDTALKKLNKLLVEKGYDKSLIFKAAIEASLTNKESFCIAKLYISDEDTKLEPVYVPISISEYDKVIYEWLYEYKGNKRATIIKNLIMDCIEIVEDKESEELPNYHILISKGITIFSKPENDLRENSANLKSKTPDRLSEPNSASHVKEISSIVNINVQF